MKKIPLFYYPTTFLFVDDDQNMLKAMSSIFSKKNKIRTFTSGATCLDFLQRYKIPLHNYKFLQGSFRDERYGLPHHLPMDFDLSKLATLNQDKMRHDEITVMVIDYKMPLMDGFELSDKLRESSIQKILLTGNKNDNKTIEGFNNNLIQRFVLKGIDNLTATLSQHLKELSLQYFQKASESLLAYLESEEKLPLSDPTFVDFFETYLSDKNINEYYLIDRQGSFLCIDEHGNFSYLAVHSERSIDNWLEIYSQDPTVNSDDIASIKTYSKIPFLYCDDESSRRNKIVWSNHLYKTQLIEGREKYFISIIPIQPNSDCVDI